MIEDYIAGFFEPPEFFEKSLWKIRKQPKHYKMNLSTAARMGWFLDRANTIWFLLDLLSSSLYTVFS